MVLAYITAKDKVEARALGLHLVKNKLAACVNIIDGMESFYWWEGKVDNSQETILIAKTQADLADRLTEEIKKKHSYSCPCVLILPIEGGNSNYMKWLQDSLQ